MNDEIVDADDQLGAPLRRVLERARTELRHAEYLSCNDVEELYAISDALAGSPHPPAGDRLEEIRCRFTRLMVGAAHPNDRRALLEDVAWLIAEVERVRAARPPAGDATWQAVERLWCEALLPEGPDAINRVTARVLALRAALRGGSHQPEVSNG